MIGLRVILLGLVCVLALFVVMLASIWLRALFSPKTNSSPQRDAVNKEPDNVIEGEFRRIDDA